MDQTTIKGVQTQLQMLRLLDEVHNRAEDFRHAAAQMHLSFVLRPEAPYESTEIRARVRGELVLSVDKFIDLAKRFSRNLLQLPQQPWAIETTVGRSASIMWALAPDITVARNELVSFRTALTSTRPGVVHLTDAQVKERAQRIIDVTLKQLDSKQQSLRGVLDGVTG